MGAEIDMASLFVALCGEKGKKKVQFYLDSASTALCSHLLGRTTAVLCTFAGGTRRQDDAEEQVHRYVRDNGMLAWKAVSAIEQGDAQELGRAMTAAQVRAFCGVPGTPEYSEYKVTKRRAEKGRGP